MTLFRVQHNANYTVVNNTICKDNRLSWKAKGIWLYAFSRPDDWQFYLDDIINHSIDGRDAVKNGLKELEEAGYLLREQKKGEDGKFQKADYCFFETPQEFQKMLPQTDFPSAVIVSSENPPLLSTEEIPSTEVKKVVVGELPPTDKNKDLEITKSDVYHFCIAAKKNWLPEEIECAWLAYENSNSSVSDVYAYIDGIIEKKRVLSKNKQMKNKIKKEEKCLKISPQISKHESKDINAKRSVQGISEQTLDSLLGPNRIRQKS